MSRFCVSLVIIIHTIQYPSNRLAFVHTERCALSKSRKDSGMREKARSKLRRLVVSRQRQIPRPLFPGGLPFLQARPSFLHNFEQFDACRNRSWRFFDDLANVSIGRSPPWCLGLPIQAPFFLHRDNHERGRRSWSFVRAVTETTSPEVLRVYPHRVVEAVPFSRPYLFSIPLRSYPKTK